MKQRAGYPKLIAIMLLLAIILIPAAFSKEATLKLLAVSQQNGKLVGSVADLYLEIQPGKGRVFIQTFPLTKLDTQISTRFANEIACKLANIDCSKYDFFYTIKSSSPIVGGPSAGAAITTITFATLMNLNINHDVAVTGTINSGGLVGPVGGLKEKIEAAGRAGIKTVLIPEGEGFSSSQNESINLSETAKKANVKIIPVNDIYQVIYYFTGVNYDKEVGPLKVNNDYLKLMHKVALDLCKRSRILHNKLLQIPYHRLNSSFLEREKYLINKTEEGEKLIKQQKYYSAASYCYTANVGLETEILKIKNPNERELDLLATMIKSDLNELNEKIDEKKYDSLTSLETYTIVKERIKDTNNFLNEMYDNLNNTEKAVSSLAAAIERLYSAKTWSLFYNMSQGTKIELNQEMVKQLCNKKILEAEERFAYVNLFLQNSMQDTKKELELAHKDADEGNYELCLFKASKAKAEADFILLAISIPENQVSPVLERKLNLTRKAIIRETEKGIFPIIGYSYYEYAQTLSKTNPISSLLYSEYAMELSNLDMYFKKDNNYAAPSPQHIKIKQFNWEDFILFAWGIVCGIIIGIILARKKF